jgi:hypothetical protein
MELAHLAADFLELASRAVLGEQPVERAPERALRLD